MKMVPCKLSVCTFVFHGVGSMTGRKRWRRGVGILIYLVLLLLSSCHFHSDAPVLWYFSSFDK